MSLPPVDAIDLLRVGGRETRLRYMPGVSTKERPTLDRRPEPKSGRCFDLYQRQQHRWITLACQECTLPPGAAPAVVASVVAAVMTVADPTSAHPHRRPSPRQRSDIRSHAAPAAAHAHAQTTFTSLTTIPSIRPGSCYAPTQAQRHPHKDERRATTQLASPDLPAAEPAVILIPIPIGYWPSRAGPRDDTATANY